MAFQVFKLFIFLLLSLLIESCKTRPLHSGVGENRTSSASIQDPETIQIAQQMKDALSLFGEECDPACQKSDVGARTQHAASAIQSTPDPKLGNTLLQTNLPDAPATSGLSSRQFSGAHLLGAGLSAVADTQPGLPSHASSSSLRPKTILVYTQIYGGMGDLQNAIKIAKHLEAQGHKVQLCVRQNPNTPGFINPTENDAVQWITDENRLNLALNDVDRIVISPYLPETIPPWVDQYKGKITALTEYNRGTDRYGESAFSKHDPIPFIDTGFGKGRAGILQLSPEEIAAISPLDDKFPFKNQNYYFGYANSVGPADYQSRYFAMETKIRSLAEFLAGVHTQGGGTNFVFPRLSDTDAMNLREAFNLNKADGTPKYLYGARNLELPKDVVIKFYRNGQEIVKSDTDVVTGKKVINVYTGNFSASESLSLLKHSQQVALTTGDQSFSEALSMRKIVFYDQAGHKTALVRGFTDEMNFLWRDFSTADPPDNHPSQHKSNFQQAFHDNEWKMEYLKRLDEVLKEKDLLKHLDSLPELRPSVASVPRTRAYEVKSPTKTLQNEPEHEKNKSVNEPEHEKNKSVASESSPQEAEKNKSTGKTTAIKIAAGTTVAAALVATLVMGLGLAESPSCTADRAVCNLLDRLGTIADEHGLSHQRGL